MAMVGDLITEEDGFLPIAYLVTDGSTSVDHYVAEQFVHLQTVCQNRIRLNAMGIGPLVNYSFLRR